MLEYTPMTDRAGNLKALCGECTTEMHKAASAAILPELDRFFDLTITERRQDLIDTPSPPLNDHLRQEAITHA